MEEQLHVMGLTNDGKLWRTVLSIQKSAESWSPWEDVEANGAGNPGPFVSVDCAFRQRDLLNSDLHVCGITDNGKLWHTVASQSGWEPFDDLTARIGGNWGEFLDVEITGGGTELHVCVIVQTALLERRILHTIRHADGTWDSFQDVNAIPSVGFPGSFIRIDCTSVRDNLHVCGVTEDGKLWHTMRSSQNEWTPFEDVQAASTNAPGPFTDVSIAEEDDNLHVCAQVGGDLWHTIRFSNPPGWQSTFDNVKAQAGDPGSFSSIDCTAGNKDGELGLLHVCGVTDDGELWRTSRFSNPLAETQFQVAWIRFEDVTKIVPGNPGPFDVVCIAAFIITVRVFFAGPPPCQDRQNEVYRDCNIIKHSSGNVKAGWQQRVRNLNQPPCSSLDIPPGCLS